MNCNEVIAVDEVARNNYVLIAYSRFYIFVKSSPIVKNDPIDHIIVTKNNVYSFQTAGTLHK